MNKSSISPSILQSLFDTAKNAANKGQAQYFTPPAWAKLLAKPLCPFRKTIVDLTCGNGQLLAGARTSDSVCLGLDIENMLGGTGDSPVMVGNLPTIQKHFVNADLCRFYPKMKAVDLKSDCFVLNPPFDLHFYRENLALLADSDLYAVREAFAAHDGRTSADTIDSTIATLCIALDRCSNLGEGFIIANESTIQRLIFADGAPHAILGDHIWAHLIIPGNITSMEAPTDGQPHVPPPGGGSAFKTAVLYFASAHNVGCRMHKECETGNITEAVEQIADSRHMKRGGEAAVYMFTQSTVELWDACRDEQLRETGRLFRPKFNIWLDQSGEIKTYLNLFDTASGTVDVRQAAMLNDLNGRRPLQLLVQREQRQALQDATKPGSPWKVDPQLQDAIANALVEYNAVRAPLYPLSPIKRLGFLDEHDSILCIKTIRSGTLGCLEFVAGQRYKIRSTTIAVNRFATKRNNAGDLEKVMYNGQELAFFITNVTDTERSFMEGRFRKEGIQVKLIRPDTKGRRERDQGRDVPVDFTLEQLTEHFEIPAVPDVATLYPEKYETHVRTLREIEAMVSGHTRSAPARAGNRLQTPFAFKKFQIEDYCRAALHDGVILGHDTGLGKTIAMFIWPILKVGYKAPEKPEGPLSALHPMQWGEGRGEVSALQPSAFSLQPLAPVLLVVPGDGHDQTDDESLKHFNVKATRLDSQETFLRLSTVDPRTGRRVLPPAYYITSYTQLTSNGVAEFPEIKSVAKAMADLHVTEADLLEYWNDRYNIFKNEYQYLGVNAESTINEIHGAAFEKSGCESVKGAATTAYETLSQITAPAFNQLKPCQRAFIERKVVYAIHAEQKAGIGETRQGPVAGCHIKCVYSPSLSDYVMDVFAVVVIDEGTKIKGDDTIMGTGVRQVNAPYRLILTATPIKNRFPDIFHLAHYVTGGHDQPTPRFPYGARDKQDICDEFLVTEQSIEEKGSRRKYSPQICNVHRVWKILSCIILRRRKDDCGEDIVPKIQNIVKVPMGLTQAAVYQYHLNAKYLDHKGKPAFGAKLQALRVASANPASELLHQVDKNGSYRSYQSFIPKVASGLELACQAMQRGEQVLIGSAFHDGLDAFSERLAEAGIPHLVLDGRKSQKARGELAREFKKGPPRAVSEGLTNGKCGSHYPIMLAGVESMAELHNFYLCNNVILTAYSWAFDKFWQFISRAHRMTSPWPVNLWSLLCEGSIDPKLNDGVMEKKDASDLVLDGRLLGDDTMEVNLADLLDHAFKQFANIKVVDEDELAKGWPRLRANLCHSYRQWATNQYIANQPILPDRNSVEIAPDASLPLWQQRFRRRR